MDVFLWYPYREEATYLLKYAEYPRKYPPRRKYTKVSFTSSLNNFSESLVIIAWKDIFLQTVDASNLNSNTKFEFRIQWIEFEIQIWFIEFEFECKFELVFELELKFEFTGSQLGICQPHNLISWLIEF